MVILTGPIQYNIPFEHYVRPCHEALKDTVRQHGDRTALVDVETKYPLHNQSMEYGDQNLPPSPCLYLRDRYGEKNVLVFDPEQTLGENSTVSYRYSQLIPLVGSVSSVFSNNFGLVDGDVVIAFIENRPEFFFLFFGVISANGVYTGINPMSTANELSSQMLSSRCRYVVTNTRLLPTVSKVLSEHEEIRNRVAKIVIFDAKDCQQKSVGTSNLDKALRQKLEPFATLLSKPTTCFPTPSRHPAKQHSMLFYSSGTTGRPKGVMHAQTMVNWYLETLPHLAGGLQPGPDDRFLAVSPFFHIAGLAASLRALATGATVYVLPKYEPITLLKHIQTFKITMFYVVPPIVVFLAKDPRVANYDFSSVRCLHYGAAPMSLELLQTLIRRFPHIEYLGQAYGMTETAIYTTQAPNLRKERIPLSSVGAVCHDIEIKIMLTDGQSMSELGAGQSGEIWVRTPFVMLGYKDQPDLTAKVLDKDGWMHTGDVGYFDLHGFLYVTGRIKDLIKYKGYQVSPEEVEDVLLKHPGVLEVVVIGRPHETDPDIGQLTTAYVVPHPEFNKLELSSDLVDLVSRDLSGYKHLRGGVRFIAQLPKGPSGKILRRKLADVPYETFDRVTNRSKL